MMIVFHSGTYISGLADTQHPFVIDMDAIVVAQIVIESPVAFIWAFCMDLFNLIRQPLIFPRSAAQFPRSPFVVGRTGHMEQIASCFNGISFFFMALFYRRVDPAMPYF